MKYFQRVSPSLRLIAGWFSWLGFWAMLHEPVHFVVFLLLLAITPLECYTAFIVFALYTYLKEAYIDVTPAKIII